MLRKFKVSNFKGFETTFELDLTETNGYTFNPECVKEGVVNGALIYGPNGVGKSNLAFALFDIIEHLTDKERLEVGYSNYLNGYSSSKVATFYYEFWLNNQVVSYEYKKSDYRTIVAERLCIGGKECVLFNRADGSEPQVELEGTETLKTDITNPELSLLKYIKSNARLEPNEINRTFDTLFEYVNRMLFFRTLNTNLYMGLNEGNHNTLTTIIELGKVADFEGFLNEAGVECKLDVVESLDQKELVFAFGERRIPFQVAASTGTRTLALFYFWYLTICQSKVSLLLIDEFDAFYHHQISELIVRRLKESGVQFILTTHNTSIMSNELLRPDCYFIMTKNAIKPLSKLTRKELREAHNLEKMYKAHAFNIE